MGEGWPGPGGKDWCTQRDGGAGGCRAGEQASKRSEQGQARRDGGKLAGHTAEHGGKSLAGEREGCSQVCAACTKRGKAASEDRERTVEQMQR